MAQASFPFDAGAGASVLEGSWQKMARAWLSTGVITGRLNQLSVSADGSAMSVSVATGQAQVEGFFYENDSALALTIATAHATLGRIDTVVVRLDRTANSATLVVVTGTAAAPPVAPTLSATDSLYELPLANVQVDAAVGVITAGKVTDRRVLTKNLTEVAATAAYVAKTLVDAKGDLLVGSAADTLVRRAVGANGTVLTADSAEADGVKWAAAAAPTLFARKTATESRTSTTTFANDTDLVVAVAASTTYELNAMIVYDGPAAGDFKFSFQCPAGAVLLASFVASGQSVALTVDVSVAQMTRVIENGNNAAGTDGSNSLTMQIQGLLRVAGTAGNLQFQWAQLASNATATRVLLDSFITLRKVA